MLVVLFNPQNVSVFSFNPFKSASSFLTCHTRTDILNVSELSSSNNMLKWNPVTATKTVERVPQVKLHYSPLKWPNRFSLRGNQLKQGIFNLFISVSLVWPNHQHNWVCYGLKGECVDLWSGVSNLGFRGCYSGFISEKWSETHRAEMLQNIKYVSVLRLGNQRWSW